MGAIGQWRAQSTSVDFVATAVALSADFSRRPRSRKTLTPPQNRPGAVGAGGRCYTPLHRRGWPIGRRSARRMTMGRMVDQTGLSERLQQHTRRSGMMVGISMATVVVLLVVS